MWECFGFEHFSFEVETLFPLSFQLLTLVSFSSLCPTSLQFFFQNFLCLLFTFVPYGQGKRRWWAGLASKSCWRASSPVFQLSARLLFSLTMTWAQNNISEYSRFLLISQLALVLLVPVTRSSQCTHPAQFSDMSKQDPMMQGSCVDTAMERIKNSQAFQPHSIAPVPSSFHVAVASICLFICGNEKRIHALI